MEWNEMKSEMELNVEESVKLKVKSLGDGDTPPLPHPFDARVGNET